MLDIVFTDRAKAEYASWLKDGNVKEADRIDALIESCRVTPFSGIGSPEPLKWGFPGKWSRRINKKDRLIYYVDGNDLVVMQCRGHYGDK